MFDLSAQLNELLQQGFIHVKGTLSPDVEDIGPLTLNAVITIFVVESHKKLCPESGNGTSTVCLK